MHRRNPHVFGDPDAEHPRDPAGVNEVWEAIKATEKQRDSVTDGLPDTLPALLYAKKALERGAQVRASGPAGDLGDRLLLLVAEAVEAGVDAEQALRDAVRRLH
jgi:XTP/dITP diphosphohydrolase